MLLGVCDLRLDLEIFDLRGPTAADNAGTTDDCPDSMVVTVSLNVLIYLFIMNTYALSFYRSQNILAWSNFFVPYQKLIYILPMSQTFFPRPKDDLRLVNSVLVPEQKKNGVALNTILFLDWHKIFGSAQNIL